MAKYSNTVEYNIKTSLDSKGLTQLKSELQGLELKLQNMGNKGLLDEKTFSDARNQIQGLGQALTDAFNPSLGMLDLSKLNQELKNNDVTAQGLKTAFSQLGSEGQVAFNNLVGELGKLDTGILRTNSQIDKLFTTFSNTFRWGLVSSFFSNFMNSIHQSVDYVKELDDSLTQIMLVTDYNRDAMNQYAKSANEAAKAVSMTTTGMTNASLVFAQQGYNLNQSQELATLSAKLANASQQDTATTSDQITAYMNAYGLQNSMEELTQQMDNWALIANISAADVSELAQASQRAASMANTVGVSGEQLAAQIATIESVTREAPEQIGNGLKTLYARFSDISQGGEDEEGIKLGDVTQELNKIGVQVLDQFGNIRDIGDIMEDLMVVWDDLDQTSKIAAAQSLAGKYQVNRFVSLMDNSDMYREYLGATGSSATGTLDVMNEEYADSIAGRSAKLQASLEGLFSTIFNTDDIYPWMDAAQGAVDLLQQFFDALGGGKTVLLGITSLLMQVFSKNMAQEINNAVTNRTVQQQKLENLQNSQAALTTLGAANPNPNDANSQNILNFAQYMQANVKNFNAEQMNQANSILQELVQNSNAATMAADKLKESLSVIGTGITATTGESILAPFLDNEGAVNATLLSEALQNMSQSEVAEMFSHIQEDIKPAREGLLEFNKALQDYQQELRNTDSTDNSWNQSLANLKATLDNLQGKIDPSTYERYEQAVNEIAEVTDKAGDKTAETTAEVAKLADSLEKVAAKDLTNLDQLNKDAFQAKNTQMAAEDSNKVAGAFQEGMESQAHIQNILNTVNAVQQLTFAWQVFQNLGSIWKNTELTDGEKFLQTLMALGPGIIQTIQGVQALQKTIETLNASNQAYQQSKIEEATITEQAELRKAQAILDTAEKSYLSAEASVNVARANVAEAQSTLTLTDAKVALAKSILEEVKARALATNNMQDYALVLRAEENLRKVQAEREQASLSLAKAQGELSTAEANAAKMGAILSKAFMGMQAAMIAYDIAAGGATVATSALDKALTALEKHPIIAAIAAALMIVTTVISVIQAQLKQAQQEAQAAFDEAKSNLEQIEALKEKISAFGEKYTAFKETGEGGNELIQQARDIAQALKDAGTEEEANALHLAILSAEAKGTAESFSVLAQEIENAQVKAEKQANENIIESSVKVLGNQNVLAKDVLNHQKMIKEYQEELNNLDPLDAGYDAEKERLEHLIDTLQNAKLAQEDLVNAANEYRQAQGRLAGMTVAENQGLNLYAGGQQGKRMNPEDAMYFENADLDYNSINRIYSNMVEGFSDLSNLEQAQFILETIGDEAGEAAAQVELLMLNFNNLDTNQIDHLQNEMAQSGFTHNQQQLLSASLDPDTTAAEFSQTIQNIAKNMSDNGTSFEIALKAEIGNPEEFQEAIRQQVESYQPLDTEIKQEDYDAMTEHFYENKDRMGEEGSGFENYSEDLFDNAEALSEVIEDTLRYSDAIEEISDNFDDWTDILNKGEKTSKEYVDAVDGLKDTFSDFLGIPEELSEEFVTTQENLNDLQLAAEGDIDAFERLQTAAAIDLAEQLGVDSDVAIAAVNEIQGALDTLGYSEIDIGETITFSDEALAQINNALDMLELDADQAAQFIESAFGFKVAPGQFEYVKNDMADVEQTAADTGAATAENMTVTPEITTASAEQVATDEKNYTDVVPDISSKTWTATLPVTGGGIGSITTASTPAPVPISGSVPVITYNATPKTATETKKDTALATGVKAEQGGSGVPKNSHVNLKPGSTGTRTGGRAPSSSAPRPSSSGGGGGGRKGSCFVAGTLITTQTSFKPIEQIQKGDIVLSYNEQIGFNQYSKVIQTMIHDTIEPIYTLYIKNEQLRVTGIHRFLITNNIITPNPQWICAEDLHIGDWVLFADGTWHVIHKIEINIEHQVVYNFEVSGNHNYYVGYNQILAHNKGGGGGKGSKAKTIEPKEKKTHQKDYYEEVSGQLDKTEKILSKIEKEEDRLIGDKARANQNKQLKLLQKEIDLNKEKQKIQQQELKDIDAEIKEQDRLAESIARTGGVYDSIPDAVFDEDGIVSNYEQISAAIDNIHNKLIDQYNAAAAAGNEDLTKKLSKTIEKFDKYGENILKSAQRHDKLQSEIEGTINELEQLQDTIEDIRIEAWKASTEAIDNIKELRENAADLEGLFSKYESDSPFRDLIIEGEKLNNIWSVGKDQAKDYYNEIIADKQKALKVATDEAEKAAIERSIKYFESLRDTLSDQRLNNGLLGLAYQDMLQLKEWYENPKAEDNPFGDNTAALRDAYEEAYNKVHDMLLEYEKTVEDYRDAIIDGYDEIDEKQNRQIDKFDRIVDKLETFSDMYTLYYGDESYAALRDILQQQGDTLREQLNAQKEIYSYWSEAYAQAIKTGDEKLIQELEDKMHDAEDRMTELAKDAAKAFAESYENAVKASTQYIIQNTIGDRSFNRLDRNWEWDKDYLDKYRDDVEKAYEMDKLRSKYTDLLNQAQGASLQTQNKIRAQMQEQLDLLDGQATVSEYDVKLANAKLEILQKQIALEDAQRNKNQMKLRRDTQGNYRYVYTANQEDVAGAEQDLLDSEYDAYELSKNQQISNYDNLINAYQKYLSQREEILNNANLSEAEKLQQNAELYDKFLKFVNAAKEDFSDAAFGTLDILNWLTLNGTDYTTTAAKDMLNDLLDEQGNIKDQTGIIWMDNANYLTNEVIPKIKNAVNEADQDIKNRMEELKENIVGDDGVFPSIREGGKDLEEGLSGLTGFLDSAKTSTDGLAVATRDLMEALSGDNSALAEAQAQLQKYEKELSNVKNASSITAQQLRDAQKALDKAQTENLNYKTLLDDIASGKRDTKGNLVNKKNTKKTGAAPSKSSKKNGELTGFTGVYHYTSWGDNPVGDWYAGIPNAVRISTFSREPGDGPYNVHLETKEGGHLGWVKEEQLFDTGGYTGNWANGNKRENGKLAFLHQKELVLNAEDTQNILAAVDIVRKIGIGLRNSMMNVSSMNGKNLSSVGETIEQRVEITASFPNATDADDIRQALIGLADKAYQYSHRNR